MFHSHDEQKSVFKKLQIRKRPESPDSSSADDFWKGRPFAGAKTEQTLCVLAYLARCGHGEVINDSAEISGPPLKGFDS